jgi:hypothetical protein
MTFTAKDNPFISANSELTAFTVSIGANSYIEIAGPTREVAGYTSGGAPSLLPGPTTNDNTIQKFPFATDTNATDVGDLSVSRYSAAGQSSTTNGYTSAGATPPRTNVIDKFPFATDASATDVGDSTAIRGFVTGQSSSSHGYTSAGINPDAVTLNIIDRFPFATDTNATDVGNLSQVRDSSAGQSSENFGYTSGGRTPPPTNSKTNRIDKFPFATNTNATTVGNLTQARNALAGQSSTVSGYASGGETAPSLQNIIDKFPFSTDTNATDVGDLSQTRTGPAGQSSTDSGYASGGIIPSRTNVIDKFPFASDTNATDVGDLTIETYLATGQQG